MHALPFPVRETTVFSSEPQLRLLRVADTEALLRQLTEKDFGPDERMPYWADLWPSALFLARLLRESGSLRGQQVVELGAGLGLVAVTAAQLGAQVTATDYFEDAVRFMEANAALNGVSLEARCMDWRHLPAGLEAQQVLAADVLYESRMVQPVAEAIAQLLVPGGTARITDPLRSPADSFAAALRAAGLLVHESLHPVNAQDRQLLLPVPSPEFIRLFQITKQ